MRPEDIAELEKALAFRREVEGLLEKAEARVRNVVVTARASGATLAEIADVAGVTKQSVHGLLKRATERDRREWQDRAEAARWDKWAERQRLAEERGLEHRAIPCEHCGRFKSRPSAECDYCGSTRLTHNGDPHELDRAYGYAG